MCVCVCVHVCVMKCAYLKAFESTPALTGWGAINNLCIDMAHASDLISQSLDLIALDTQQKKSDVELINIAQALQQGLPVFMDWLPMAFCKLYKVEPELVGLVAMALYKEEPEFVICSYGCV